MQNRTDIIGVSLIERIKQLLQTNRKWVAMGGAVASGYVMAASHIFGGVAPFGVAFCASLRGPYSVCAALGAILGYTFSTNPLTNMKYLAAVILVVTLKWLFGGKVKDRFATAASAITTLIALAVASTALAVVSDATVYDVVMSFAEIFLGAGAAYFFSRTLLCLEAGWTGLNRSDISCLIVSFAIVIMGFATIQVGSLSVGRMLSVLIILICARAGGEAGGAVAGITAGIAMGLTGGDYAYVISAYGFGGLLAGVFSNLGRIATASSFILINTVAALFTQQTSDVYTSILEIFVASVLFVAIPQSWIAKLKVNRLAFAAEVDTTAQETLRDRLGDVSGALLEISDTTRKVSERLQKIDGTRISGLYTRVADRACKHCGMRTTCWQFRYSDTMNALNDAILVLKRDGSVNRTTMPGHFVNTCCRLEDFLAELNTQFTNYVAKQGVQLKVSKVRSVVTDQFEGMAMMMEEIASDLCDVRMMDNQKAIKVQEYFEREGLSPQKIFCYSDEYDRMAVELLLPTFQIAKLKKQKATLDLCELLEAEFDQPHIVTREQKATVLFAERATYTVELGAHQIASKGHRLCGDAYDILQNRTGRAHVILSDGMGSGGSAAVDSAMATGLISRLLSVGFSHEAALKMVNSALLIKSGEESLATIDICSLDLYSGHADFYKAGAAPTFLIKGGRAGQVESTSLPAGILQGVAFEKSGITLHEGDRIIMVSDGVIATGMDWVKSELEMNRETELQQLCESLANTARDRRTDGREDDITVVAVGLKKGA